VVTAGFLPGFQRWLASSVRAFERAIVASVIAKRYVARALMRAVALLAEPIDVDRFILGGRGGGEKRQIDHFQLGPGRAGPRLAHCSSW